MPDTTTYMGLKKPTTSETADIDVLNWNMDHLDTHEHDGGSKGLGVKVVQSGAVSARPNPTAGQLYVATDEQVLYFAAGDAWTKLQNAPLASGKIAEQVVTPDPLASVDFNNIPQTYRHLEIRWQGVGTGTSYYLVLSFNDDATAANYYSEAWWAGGAADNPSEYLGTGFNGIYVGLLGALGGGAGTIFIPNYSGAQLKSVISSFQSIYSTVTGYTRVGHHGGWWNNGNAITKITLSGTSLGVGSVFTLLGHGPTA